MNEQVNKKKIPLVVLVGPTAVGKTELAIKLASILKTEIISADSAQVYQLMNIGTAKPKPDELQLVKHHLIDLVKPDQLFSVATYQNVAEKIINLMWKEHKLPFMVGGTGLYIRAVMRGYAFGQKGPDIVIREIFEKQADQFGLTQLYNQLESLDPDAAKNIHPNDRKRIIRALEVFNLEGKSILEQVTGTYSKDSPYKTVCFGLTMDRQNLYSRIERRVDQMINDGFVEEVEKLIGRWYKAEDPGMKVLGYRQLYAFLNKHSSISWSDMIENIKKETRNLAKRQLTWFRRESDINWIKIDEYDSLNPVSEIICNEVKDLAH
jgi:tRNA dimethylallyltransferase